MKRKAILSVSDKTNLAAFAQGLYDCGIELYSTGGTKKFLLEHHLKVQDIGDLTDFPEIMDGRVKTLHPKVHGGILALRDNPAHKKTAEEHQFGFIDFVVVNLYPFEQSAADENVTLEEALQNIDIGGSTMLRSAAKNYKFVTVVSSPKDYPSVLEEIKQTGGTSLKTREKLAVSVFHHTAGYDGSIDQFLAKRLLGEERIRLQFDQGVSLRYGENPHQGAKLYKDKENQHLSLAYSRILHGKKMSYNNFIDAENAVKACYEQKNQICAAVVKHSNPCGLATGETSLEALENAWEGDIVSAFGSVIACNAAVDLETAQYLKGKFVEVLAAPSYTEEALAFLKQKSKNLRIVQLNLSPESTRNRSCRFITGGLLLQNTNKDLMREFQVVTPPHIAPEEKKLYEFAFGAVKWVKSNAIVICHQKANGSCLLMGMGAGQPNRVDSIKKLAVPKAVENIKRLYPREDVKNLMSSCVLASDAFFPFPDNIVEAHRAGIQKIIQPGGSIRDKEIIETCRHLGVSMVFTGTRHFHH